MHLTFPAKDAIEHGIEHFPAIAGSIAMEKILHHMRDVGAALMRAVDVVVIRRPR
jgi:hypothetical protein